MYIVFDTGNPWVSFRSSIPVPANTRTRGPRVRIWTGFATDTDTGMQPVCKGTGSWIFFNHYRATRVIGPQYEFSSKKMHRFWPYDAQKTY